MLTLAPRVGEDAGLANQPLWWDRTPARLGRVSSGPSAGTICEGGSLFLAQLTVKVYEPAAVTTFPIMEEGPACG